MNKIKQNNQLKIVIILGLFITIAAVAIGSILGLFAHTETSNKVSANVKKHMTKPTYDVITDNLETSNHYYHLNNAYKTAVIGTAKDSSRDNGVVTVPSYVKNGNITYTVVGIHNYAYLYSAGMTGVIIPDTIKYVGNMAFYGTPITTVRFGKGLVSIGEHAFQQTKLTSVTVPNHVESISKQAFDQIPGNKDDFISIGKNTTYVTDGEKSSFGSTELDGKNVPYKPLIRK